MWDEISDASETPFLGEPAWKWFLMIGFVGGSYVAWRAVLDYMK